MQCLAWKKRNPDRRELNSDPDRASPLSGFPREQEFIVAKTAIGSLDDMLGGAQLAAPGKISVNAVTAALGQYRAVGSRQVPDARPAPRRVLSARVADEHFGALVGKRIVALATKHYADVRRIQLQREFGARLHGSAAIGRRRKDFHTLQGIWPPLVSRRQLIGRGRVRGKVVVLRFAGRIAERQLVGLEQRRRRQSVPIGNRFVVLDGLILTAM